MPQSNSEVVMQIFGGGLAAIGVLIAYGTLRTRVKVAASRRWPTVTGTVLVSEVAVQSSRNTSGQPIKIYSADIPYEYKVGDKYCTGDAVKLGGSIETSRRDSFEALVVRYPVGRKVRVYYDPSDPVTAMLEPGELGGVFNMMMVALGFVVVGGLFFSANYFALGR